MEMVEESAPNGTRRRRRHPSSSSLNMPKRRRILSGRRQPLRMTMILLLFLLIAVTVEAKVTKTEIVFCGGGGSNCGGRREEDEGKQLSRLFGGKSIQMLTFNNHRRRVVVDQPAFLSRTRRKRRMINEQRQRKEFELQVQELVRLLRTSLIKVGPTGTVLHITYSQGALLTQWALTQLSALELHRLQIISFGGTSVVQGPSPHMPLLDCRNYYSHNDPVRSLLLSVSKQPQQYGNNNNICWLDPILDDPVADHELWAPTYYQALQCEGRRYQQLYRTHTQRLSFVMSEWILGLFTTTIPQSVRRTVRVLSELYHELEYETRTQFLFYLAPFFGMAQHLYILSKCFYWMVFNLILMLSRLVGPGIVLWCLFDVATLFYLNHGESPSLSLDPTLSFEQIRDRLLNNW